tara:strand:+ start:124 stop:930 length:807 start_codon:yes stop_codon:yes gene_type:complete
MTKLLHIGLGKCASSFLQHEIFPRIGREYNISYNPSIFLQQTKKNFKFHIFEDVKDFQKNLPNNFILSYEDLFSKEWEFSRINKSFEYIKNNFSNDTVVLIIIRNPYDLLSSIFCESIEKIMYVDPKNFFYNENIDNIRFNGKFNLYNFDYNKLISLYKSYFKKVIVVKYENLNDLNFLKKIFDINYDIIKKFNIKNKIQNRSLSEVEIKSLIFLNKILGNKKSIKFLRKTYLKLIMKLLPYKKYYFNKNFIPIDINNQISEYNNLKF